MQQALFSNMDHYNLKTITFSGFENLEILNLNLFIFYYGETVQLLHSLE